MLMATRPNTTGGASAPSNIVPIRPGIRIRRRPHQDDIQTSILANCYRKALAEAQSLAGQPEQAWQAAIKAAQLKSAVPALNLRCINGTRDIRGDYALRLAEMEEARAKADSHSATMNVWAAREAGEQGRPCLFVQWPDEMVGHQHRLRSIHRQATLDFARSPSPTSKAHAEKRKLIGRIWLGAEGSFYDQLRAAMAEDEARLADQRRAG